MRDARQAGDRLDAAEDLRRIEDALEALEARREIGDAQGIALASRMVVCTMAVLRT